MKKTLKDVFLEEDSFLVDIPLGNSFSIYIEGLDNIGCGIFDLNYKVEDVEYFCVELIFNGEMIKNISNHNITLNTTIEEIKKFGIEIIRKGYRAITSLDNDNELTDVQLLEYMKNILLEERED